MQTLVDFLYQCIVTHHKEEEDEDNQLRYDYAVFVLIFFVVALKHCNGRTLFVVQMTEVIKNGKRYKIVDFQ